MRYVSLLLLLSAMASGQVVNSRPGRKIMVFGGRNHDVYLGCLSCSDLANDSVLNEFSNYGSEFSDRSILNQFGAYGSKYQATSACNEFATSPPVVVDNRGTYYGELTMNEMRPKRVHSDAVLKWLAGVCETH